MTILDAIMSAEARDKAIKQVGENATQEWKAKALETVKILAETQRDFTSDALWQWLEKPREPRALGAVMVQAFKLGWIERTSQFLPSLSVSQHRRPLRVWESKIFVEGKGDE